MIFSLPALQFLQCMHSSCRWRCGLMWWATSGFQSPRSISACSMSSEVSIFLRSIRWARLPMVSRRSSGCSLTRRKKCSDEAVLQQFQYLVGTSARFILSGNHIRLILYLPDFNIMTEFLDKIIALIGGDDSLLVEARHRFRPCFCIQSLIST